MATEANDERLLTVNDVAERLQLHPITVRRHIKAGQLRAVRIGRSVRIREADLEEYLEAGDYEQVEYPTPSPEAIAEVRRILDSVPRQKPPHQWPPSQEEMARRKKLTEETFRRRDERGPIGITTQELVRQSRRELEEKYERTSGRSSRRLRRGKMASDRREPYEGS